MNFREHFEALTSYGPFPWQTDLYESWFMQGQIPDVCDIPTGLGKTSVIAVWLIARASGAKLPRRLVYVVNRRTVVDQTTNEVEKLRERLAKPEDQDLSPEQIKILRTLAASLSDRSGTKMDVPLAISTLRGQFADNQEWSTDPARPAVICGTVDMIGSRLLFSGYRIGFKSRPLHAGFLGQDSLLIHDEAHLEPAFQTLIEGIEGEQNKREKSGDLPWPKLRVMSLSATTRNGDNGADRKVFLLSEADHEHYVVQRRIEAKKSLILHPCDDEKKNLVKQVVERASEYKGSGAAIVVFVRGVEDAIKIADELETVVPDHVCSLTGTMRGYERDELVKSNGVFARFMPTSNRSEGVNLAEGTVYLVSTSAGEVGVNISADHMVSDLSTFDSMAQRLGRVNRFGDHDDTRIDIVHPVEFDDKEPNPQREKTLRLLEQLNGNASPSALGVLAAEERIKAFAPTPTILPATDILFDAWALTTIREKLPGRPPVEPYLHGVADWEPPRTSVAWREEVGRITEELIERHGEAFPQELLEDYPLKPHELLSDRTDRVLTALQELCAKHPMPFVWIVDQQGAVQVKTLRQIANSEKTKAQDRRPLEQAIAGCIVLLSPETGGLSSGMLNGNSNDAADVADKWYDESGKPRRERRLSDEAQPFGTPNGMALIRTIDLIPLAEETEAFEQSTDTEYIDEEIEAEKLKRRQRYWHWYALPRDAEDATRASAEPITWTHHTVDVVDVTTKIVEALNLPNDLKQAVILAAEFHDLGKQRELWQRGIGNPSPGEWYAKPGKPKEGRRWRPRRLSDYRHEFGSLLDILDPDSEHIKRLELLSDDMQDVVLHLIAVHHGRARPHFEKEETVDPNYSQALSDGVATEVIRRYSRLQRRYGRWGLAYLESLLRAADWAASANPSDLGGKA